MAQSANPWFPLHSVWPAIEETEHLSAPPEERPRWGKKRARKVPRTIVQEYGAPIYQFSSCAACCDKAVGPGKEPEHSYTVIGH
jgi:hypothetical protein